MSQVPFFCSHCGAPGRESAQFCTACGNRYLSATTGSGAPTPILSAPPVNQTSPGPAPAAPLSPPQSWQVVTGSQLPAFQPRPEPETVEAGIVAARPRDSLRQSVFWLAVASTTELFTAYATGNSASLETAGYRAGLTVVSLLAGLIAGRRRGIASFIVLLGTLGLAGLQGLSLGQAALQALEAPEMLSNIMPSAVTQGAALLTALRTVWKSAR